MKAKSISQVHQEAKKEFANFFGVEKEYSQIKALGELGTIMSIFWVMAVGFFFISEKEVVYLYLAGSFIFVQLVFLVIILFLRKSLIQVRRMMKEFKGVKDAKTMQHFLVRNEQFRNLPFFSQELARFIMDEDENYTLFPIYSLNLLNNIFSYLEENNLGFRFDSHFFYGILNFNFKDRDFPTICIIVVGEKEKADNVAKALKSDYSVKTQKEPLFTRFIDCVFGEEESVGLNFKIVETCEKVEHFPDILLEFPEFYSDKQKYNV
jgi:hypothetical protein